MATLRSHLAVLAASFANSVLDAIRGARLEELLVESTGGGARRGPGRLRGSSTKLAPAMSKRGRTTKPGRLKRRTATEIAKALDRVVALVKGKKAGMRAEQIRAALGMQAKEMPRVLKEGLSKRKLKAEGQKRATTYTSTDR